MNAKKSTKKTKAAAKRAPKDLTARTRVAGLEFKVIVAQMVTSITNLAHGTAKGIAQNLRA